MHRTQVYLINDSSANTLKCSQKTHFLYLTSYLYLICCLIVSLAPSLTNNHRCSGATKKAKRFLSDNSVQCSMSYCNWRPSVWFLIWLKFTWYYKNCSSVWKALQSKYILGYIFSYIDQPNFIALLKHTPRFELQDDIGFIAAEMQCWQRQNSAETLLARIPNQNVWRMLRMRNSQIKKMRFSRGYSRRHHNIAIIFEIWCLCTRQKHTRNMSRREFYCVPSLMHS